MSALKTAARFQGRVLALFENTRGPGGDDQEVEEKVRHEGGSPSLWLPASSLAGLLGYLRPQKEPGAQRLRAARVLSAVCRVRVARQSRFWTGCSRI